MTHLVKSEGYHIFHSFGQRYQAICRNLNGSEQACGHRLSDLMSKGKVEIRVRRAFTSSIVLGTIVRLSQVRLGKRWKRRGRKGMVSSVIVTKNRIRLVMYRNCLETRESDMKLRLSPWRYLKVHSINSSGKHEHISSAAAAIVTDNESDSFTCSLALYMVCLFAPSLLMRCL